MQVTTVLCVASSATSLSPSELSSSSMSSSQAGNSTEVLPSDWISTACHLQDLIPVKEKKRPRKPSPPRQSRPFFNDWVDEFLARGCKCASKCSEQFDREYYSEKRDQANSLSWEMLDVVVLGQIQAFTGMDNVVGPSHKHSGKRFVGKRS